MSNTELGSVNNSEAIDSSAGNASPTTVKACRAISCDTGGIIKIQCRRATGGLASTQVMVLAASTLYPIRDVKTVYRYYTGTTPCTATVFPDAGTTQHVGIRLWDSI